MDMFTEEKTCKYCTQNLEMCSDEGLECDNCKSWVHVRCLKRGSVPGGLKGDLFYTFVCKECSPSETESFTRNKLSWLQIIILVVYHLQRKSPGLARKGFFHWRNHVAMFIDRNWEILFPNDKKKKKWTGTIAGTLSHFSSYIFLSGTATFNEPAWWTLMYPKLSPLVVSQLYSLMNLEKQRAKINNEKLPVSDAELFQNILSTHINNEDLIQPYNVNQIQVASIDEKEDLDLCLEVKNVKPKTGTGNKRKINFPSIENTSKKLMKLSNSSVNELTADFDITSFQEQSELQTTVTAVVSEQKTNYVKLLDPYCHFNTSLNNIARIKGQRMQIKLTGGVRKEQILSPYSALYLKPYIRRDTETIPVWLRLMAELQVVANRKNPAYDLPPRAPLDYVYVQPEHIPAINSLCNHFFWPGIDLTETLQYPDFSCVVLYKRLIVGFAFLVPDVKHTESYISFVFTRPNWRNCGIATFMIYHLIQTSLGKDITLHVSINNPALFLYQKFGFKVENVELDFYDKYFRSDVSDSKHAFFCRLER